MKFSLFVFALIASFNILFSQTKTPEEVLDIMKQMGELTDKHDFLDEFAGEWNVNLLNYSGEDELAGSGTAVVARQYRGHYLEISLTVDVAGAPMISKINIGYDTRYKQFFLISMDDVTNYPLILQKGTMNKEDKSITFTGKDFILMLNKEINEKVVLKKERDNKFTLKVYFVDKKSEKLMIEYHFIKKPE